MKFQSTHSHGVRHRHNWHAVLTCKFQSTHSHGVRLPKTHRNNVMLDISINALAWSATQSYSTYHHIVQISINALAWSATELSKRESALDSTFQSTHSHGVRLWGKGNIMAHFHISINALAWSAT